MRADETSINGTGGNRHIASHPHLPSLVRGAGTPVGESDGYRFESTRGRGEGSTATEALACAKGTGARQERDPSRGIMPPTKAMIEEAESKIQRLSKDEALQTPTLATLRVLPNIVAKFAEDIGRLARHDVTRARAALEDFLGQIVLKPKDDALVAVVQGNLAALLHVESRKYQQSWCRGTVSVLSETLF